MGNIVHRENNTCRKQPVIKSLLNNSLWRNQWHLEIARQRDDLSNFNFIYQNWNTCIWNFVKSGFWLGWNDVSCTTIWNCVGTGEIYIPDKPFQNTMGFSHLGVTSRNSLRKTTTVMWIWRKIYVWSEKAWKT